LGLLFTIDTSDCLREAAAVVAAADAAVAAAVADISSSAKRGAGVEAYNAAVRQTAAYARVGRSFAFAEAKSLTFKSKVQLEASTLKRRNKQQQRAFC
jgi:hypothetical protein